MSKAQALISLILITNGFLVLNKTRVIPHYIKPKRKLLWHREITLWELLRESWKAIIFIFRPIFFWCWSVWLDCLQVATQIFIALFYGKRRSHKCHVFSQGPLFCWIGHARIIETWFLDFFGIKKQSHILLSFPF